MNLNGILLVSLLAFGGMVGTYKYGSRGPDLTLSTAEQSMLLRDEFVHRVMLASAPGTKRVEEHSRQSLARMTALLAKKRCYGCNFRLSMDTALFSIEVPTIARTEPPVK